MIFTATQADGSQIQDITARAGVFSQEEIDSVPEMFDDYLKYGTEGDGYHFIVYRDGEQVLGYAIYGYRDLTDGVYDLYWIAVDPNARRRGAGRALLTASENDIRNLGGRIIIVETSGTPEYDGTREFYISTGYINEAIIKDYYKLGDDLWIFTKKV
jgi:ribosomal protein S18 acetylase RimI-like enzyme